ncbi:MAE_28990/MAE_18760 family HEPN-like nuclease [Corallococcus sp. AS-1-6]|uniref:MAE_28990/MAE_18760 family HEPN-like nuclease n=1 Tax=Corallococcus sp. AS-1-6 TaxID=2874599 RepID=UPI001CBC64AA|nr:hypothetical protein [Corallococcus sp. AS-1-6]
MTLLSTHRQETYARLQEVRATLEVIKRLESTDIQTPDPAEVAILRGLFFVHLYGVLEHCVNSATQAVLQHISQLNVRYSDFIPSMHSIALDGVFTSLGEIKKGRWEKRLELIRTQLSPSACAINPLVFAKDLQNIWYKTLLALFDCLGLSSLPVPDIRLKQYIDEIADKRNAVAHGRESPVQAVAGRRSPDLEIRFQAVVAVVEHIFDCFELYLKHREFIRQDQRSAYP